MTLDIERMYAALETERPLATLVEAIAASFGTRSALLQIGPVSGQSLMTEMSYWPAEVRRRYASEYCMVKDPWGEAIMATGSFGRPALLDGVVPPDMFQRSEMFNDLLRPAGDDTGRAIAFVQPVNGNMLVMAAHRASTDRAFDDGDSATMSAVHNHVSRILRLRDLLEQERTSTRQMQATIDGTGRAILLVGKTMEVLQLSAAAQACLDRRDGLGFRGGRLDISDPTRSSAVRSAVSATIDRRDVPCSAFLIPRRSGPPCRLLVLPAGSHCDHGALIVLDDPHAAPPARSISDVLTQLYGLSKAEAELCARLAEDRTLDDIAALRGVTKETLRTQLRSIFGKTGTSRQSALVRLVATLPL